MQAPQSRRLAENVVPNTPVPGLVPPPNTVIHSFSPCGRYLIAFQPVTSEVVAYRFKGLHMASGAKSAEPTAAPPAQAADQHGPHAAHQQQGTAQSWQRQDGQQEQPQEPQAEGEQGQPVAFGDIFEEHWRCCPCPGRQEQISPEFCAGAGGEGETHSGWSATTAAASLPAYMTENVPRSALQLPPSSASSPASSHLCPPWQRRLS